jgi:hypothetical protein
MKSGYLSGAEYRAIKEPDQETDFIIRYYPGPAAKESNGRIQTYIRDKKNRRHLRAAVKQPTEQSSTSTLAHQPLAISVITADHHELISQLIVNFRINPIKACNLVITRREAVSAQLEAWRFRQAKPRNPAGWMIQAIENNYDPPASYLDHKIKQNESRARQAAKDKMRNCPICDDKGFRQVRSAQYPSGAMKQCTHDSSIESQEGLVPGDR